MERAETKTRDLERSSVDKDSRIETLSKQLKTAEEQVLLEQKQRQNAQEQVLLFVTLSDVQLACGLSVLRCRVTCHTFFA